MSGEYLLRNKLKNKEYKRTKKKIEAEERILFGKVIVTTLCDSRANVLARNWKLVSKSAYTGKYVRCWTFSGRDERFSQIRMFIRTLYFTGLAENCSLRKPVAGIIVEQLTGIKECNHQEIQAWYKKIGLAPKTVFTRCGDRSQTHSTQQQHEEANAVSARSECRRHEQRLLQERRGHSVLRDLHE